MRLFRSDNTTVFVLLTPVARKAATSPRHEAIASPLDRITSGCDDIRRHFNGGGTKQNEPNTNSCYYDTSASGGGWRGGDLNQDNDFIVVSVDSVRGNDGGASINQWRIHY